MKIIPHSDAYVLERQGILQSYFQDIMAILHPYHNDKYSTLVDKDSFDCAWQFGEKMLERPIEQLLFDDYLYLLGLVSVCEDLIGFGLQTGNIKSIKNFGIYGYALMSSSTLDQFNAVADRIFNAIYEPLIIRHDIVGEMLNISYIPISPIVSHQYIPLMEQVVLCGISLMKARLPVEADWQNCIINCNYPKPAYVAQYQDYFSGQVNFETSTMQLCVPIDWLKLSNETGNEFIYTQCENKIDKILGSLHSKNNLSGKVRHILLSRSFNDMPSIVEIADSLYMVERTLRYQLAKEETSFRRILNEVRGELAKRYLCESDLSIQEIAFSLGYNHTQNFYRAFLKEIGTTPEQFRKQYQTS
jgi:AraC-like DNA-binding protein